MPSPKSTMDEPNTRAFDLAQKSVLAGLAKNSNKTLLGMLGTAAVFASIGFHYEADLGLILTAFCVTCLTQVLRFFVETPPSKSVDSPELGRNIGRYVCVAGVCGLAISLNLIFLRTLPIAIQSISTLVYLIIATSAINNVNGHPLLFRTFMLSILAPLALAWVSQFRNPELHGLIGYLVGSLITVYGFVLWGYASTTWEAVVEVVYLRNRDQSRAAELGSALTDAIAANTAKTRFLATASHDLRQPIHTISLLTSVLKLRHGTGSSAEVIQMLDTVIVSLSRQLDDLLDISKLDAGIFHTHFEWLDLSQFVQTLGAEHAPQIEAKGLAAVCAAPPSRMVYFDQALLARVLRNLISNAIKFTSEGSIGVTLTYQDNAAIITVRDTGRGISKEHQTEVFNEFFQVDNAARTRSEGLGLGLAIVKKLCALMAVQLEMKSTPARGTEFLLTLDAATAMAMETATATATVTAACTDKLKLSVLVVDDETEVCASTAFLLQELGCSVKTAVSTQAAQNLCEDWQPDVLIADFRLTQGGTGFKTIELVQARWPAVQSIIMTGDTAGGELLAFNQTNFSILHKPVHLKQLLAVLSQIQSKLIYSAPLATRQN